MAGGAPAGWYGDPLGRHEHRYWNGSEWTEHVSNRGVPATDPVGILAAPAAAAEPAQVGPGADSQPVATTSTSTTPTTSSGFAAWARSHFLLATLLIVGVPLLLIGVAGALIGDSDDDRAVTTEEAADVRTTSPTLRRESSTTSTVPPTTTNAPPTTTTTVYVPPPPPPPPAPPPTAAPAPPAPSGCDPNYSGCVPIASDVDCAGGSGNGPAYVSGPVQVIGSDIYDLDSDGDGWGCED